jgi:acetoin utilization protein AcuB
MRIYDVMTKKVATVPPTSTVDEAADLMRRKRIRHLVVSTGDRVDGVVSDRDVHFPALFGEPIADAMTGHAVTIGPNESVQKAAKRMRTRRVSCLPVVERGKLVGIVTVSDLLHVLERTRAR